MSGLWAVLQPNDDCLEKKEPTENTWILSKAVWLNYSKEAEAEALTSVFNIVISVPVTSGRPQRPILLLKTTLFFSFSLMSKILVCLSTEVYFINSFAQPETPHSVCDESRAPIPGWTLQAMSKWWETEQDWVKQGAGQESVGHRCALWSVTGQLSTARDTWYVSKLRFLRNLNRICFATDNCPSRRGQGISF